MKKAIWRFILLLAVVFLLVPYLLGKFLRPFEIQGIEHLTLREVKDSTLHFEAQVQVFNPNSFNFSLHNFRGGISWKGEEMMQFFRDEGAMQIASNTFNKLKLKGTLPLTVLDKNWDNFLGHKNAEVDFWTRFSPFPYIPPFIYYNQNLKVQPEQMLWKALRLGSGLDIRNFKIRPKLKSTLVTCDVKFKNNHAVPIHVEELKIRMKMKDSRVWLSDWSISEPSKIQAHDSLFHQVEIQIPHHKLILGSLGQNNILDWDIEVKASLRVGDQALPRVRLRLSPRELL